jgi:lipopolysaccharide export system protein LptC
MLVAGAIALALVPACRSSQQTGSTAVAPELKLERVRFRVWRGDVLRVRGEARKVTIRRDTSHADASDLQAELPARDQPVTITARSAEGDLSAQVFTGEGGVVVTHAGERAVTDRARYEPGPSGKGLVTGRDPVIVERGNTRADGVGFTFEPETGELQLGGPVTTRSSEGGR